SRRFFERPPADLPPRPPSRPPVVGPAGAAPLFRVTALEGAVEFFHGEQWYVAQAGDQLALQDVIRTRRGGRAWLRRGGTEIEVAGGFESTAAPGRPPGGPEPIPQELLLSVTWPDRIAAETPVAGKVRPSSRVKVNGVEARVRPDGTFSLPLPLEVGPNAID